LGGRVVGQLALVQDHTATLPVSDGVVLLEVLDEQARGRDIVTVDHEAVSAGVGHPPLVVAEVAGGGVEALDAVVGPPNPGVISRWS
jgi:hypothetical protein